jgi:hypothetical protein
MKHRHKHRRHGIVRTQVSLSSEEIDVLLKLKPVFERELRERFGRDLRPDDPVFWSRSRMVVPFRAVGGATHD